MMLLSMAGWLCSFLAVSSRWAHHQEGRTRWCGWCWWFLGQKHFRKHRSRIDMEGKGELPDLFLQCGSMVLWKPFQTYKKTITIQCGTRGRLLSYRNITDESCAISNHNTTHTHKHTH
uniref:Putative secreted protein n=1 Tax=Anopheles darlingi TaxID=43151 RepID=A0A2M4DMY8_ANODA